MVFAVVVAFMLVAICVTLWRSNKENQGVSLSGVVLLDGNDISIWVITTIEHYRPGWISRLWYQSTIEKAVSVVVFEGEGFLQYGTEGTTITRPTGEVVKLDTRKSGQYWIRKNNVVEEIRPRLRRKGISCLVEFFGSGDTSIVNSWDGPADLRSAIRLEANKRSGEERSSP